MSPNKKYKFSIFSLPCTHPTDVQQWSHSLVLVQFSECYRNSRGTGEKLVLGAEEVKTPTYAHTSSSTVASKDKQIKDWRKVSQESWKFSL